MSQPFRRYHPCGEEFRQVDFRYLCHERLENVVQAIFCFYDIGFAAAENRGVRVPGKAVGEIAVEQTVQAAQVRVLFWLDEQHAIVEMADVVQSYCERRVPRSGCPHPRFQFLLRLDLEAAERNVKRNVHGLRSRLPQAQHAVLKSR